MRNYKSKLVDNSRLLADILVKDIGNDTVRFKEMMNLALLDRYPLSMRAARVVALTAEGHPDFLIPFIPQLISRLQHLTTEGVRRSFLKTLSEHSYPFSEEQLGILADLAFTWLSDPKEAIAIRYYSIEILLIVAKLYPEIRIELKSILEELLEDQSSGLRAKSIKVINYLRKL